MPNTLSSKKRVRQNARQRAINLWRKRRIKNQVRSFMSAVEAADVSAAKEEFRKTCSLLDRIACTRTIHPNAAARKKSRLSSRLKALMQKKS